MAIFSRDWSGTTVDIRLTSSGSVEAGYSGSVTWSTDATVPGAEWHRETEHAAFSHRDTSDGFEFGGLYWISNGYQYGGNLIRDLWSSADGLNWTLVNDDTPYPRFSQMVAFDGYIYAIGDEVWRSTDGITWELIQSQTPVEDLSEATVFQGKLWAFGADAAWSSADGIAWTQEADLPFGPRYSYSLASLDGRLIIAGGVSYTANDPPEAQYPGYTSHNDVWTSSDGITWELLTEHAAWSPRFWTGFHEHNGNLYLLGGFDNVNAANLGDVWVSPDGENWTRVTGDAFTARHFPTVFSIDNNMVLLAGNGWPTLNDIWIYEDDGLLPNFVFTDVTSFDLRLGSGDDVILTGDGNDVVDGGAGDDWLNTGRGVDQVAGGLGADRWEADQSDATQEIVIDLHDVSSYRGTGSVSGIEMLTLTTGSGDDRVTTLGEFYADVVTTGDGSDAVTVGGGRDFVDLGIGFDTLTLNWSSASADYELLDLSGDLFSGYSGVISAAEDTPLRNRVEFSGVERFAISLGSGNDVVRTGDGDDIISGGAGNDDLFGQGGADVIQGGWGEDYITGGQGDDLLTGDPFAPGPPLASAGGWTAAGHGLEPWYIGDFNGDGRDDIFRYLPMQSGADVWLSNGAAFTPAGSWTAAGHDIFPWTIGDFNGDGMDDIFRYSPGVSGAEMFLSNGSSFGASVSWTAAGNGTQGWYVGDFNGDGRDDVLRYINGVSGAQVFTSNGTGFTGGSSWTGASNNGRWYVGDFNGDGRDDVFRYNPGVSGAEMFLSNGSSFVAGGSWTGAGNGSDGWYVGDFDGDGRDDIARYFSGQVGANVWLSKGDAFVDSGNWLGVGRGAEPWYIGDFNGDGGADLFRYMQGETGADMYLSRAGDQDTFVFEPDFGHDVIYNFQTVGLGHDVLKFTGLDLSTADVLAQASQIGADTVIAFDDANSIILKNVLLSHLSAVEMIFV